MVMTNRLLGGFAAMPFVAAAVGFLIAVARTLSDARRPGGTPFDAGMGAAILLFLAALAIVCLAAGPLFFWWTKRHESSLIADAAWGALLGNIPFVLAVVIFVSGRMWRGESLDGLGRMWLTSAIGATTGLVCGIVFWILTRTQGAKTDPVREMH